MHSAANLAIKTFGEDSLSKLSHFTQAQYLVCYFADLGASVVLEEPNYFDRDYLSEFAAFYSLGSRGYPNVCRRLHFFSGSRISRKTVRQAAGGSSYSLRLLQESYLGFVVQRPIPTAPLGRTVVRWYPERLPATPRITSPSRDYACHVAGLTLTVHGLAWQQQDTGVSACATVGIWSMLHSSAFDDHHAVPTTTEITRAAHKTASLGSRMFPSAGLTVEQLLEAIKEQQLAPAIISGELFEAIEIKGKEFKLQGFGRERLASSLASLIRSGYPVLLVGQLGTEGKHAICATGFRESGCAVTDPQQISLQDCHTDFLYIHDDNLGPNVRFRLTELTNNGLIALRTDPPTDRKLQPSPTLGYPEFVPEQLIVAVHDDLRISPDFLHKEGLSKATGVLLAINAVLNQHQRQKVGVTLSTRFIKLHNYIGSEIERLFSDDPKLLARVRLQLQEKVPPMSLHIGVVRIALSDSTPLVDILYDTTDTEGNAPVFASIAFNIVVSELIKLLPVEDFGDFGYQIVAA